MVINSSGRTRLRAAAAVYAAGHFLIDFSCALVILSLGSGPWHFFAYNFCAFAMQMPVGLLADIFGRNRRFALTGICLVLLSVLPLGPWIRVICAGIGNACYHVGGGREALLDRKGLTGLGIFVSPGAIGIFLGAMLSGNTYAVRAAVLGLILCGILILRLCGSAAEVDPKGKPSPRIAALMFLVVILRSLVGLCMENPWKIGLYVTFGAIAGAFGKALGGIAADRLGAKRVGVVSLLLAAVLFCLPDVGIAGVLGCLLFNMTMPITLGRAADACPGYEGFSFGLLTFGLFLGYVPSFLGIRISPYLGAVLAVISAVLLALDREDGHG